MNMLRFTLNRLDKLAKRGEVGQGLLKYVAAATGVPHRTIQKLTSRAVSNPRIATLEPLYNYLVTKDAELAELDRLLCEAQNRRIDG